MTRWLALGLLVASLSGAFPAYLPVSIGSSGLQTLATNLLGLAPIVNNYYASLNTGRTVIFAALIDLFNTMNTTYVKLNATYNATQGSNLQSVQQMVLSYNNSLQYASSMIDSNIAMDMSQLSSGLQQSIDSLYSAFGYTTYTMSMPSYENCLAKNVTNMTTLPNVVSQLGPCLQQEVNMANVAVQAALGSISLAKANYVAYNAQFSAICQTTSPNCISQYFSSISMEPSPTMSELYLVQSYLSYLQTDASNRNNMCVSLVKAAISDATQNIMSAISSCAYPTMSG